jgi:hypothetical protein
MKMANNNKPEIRLSLEYDWYSKLMAALKGNAMTDKIPEMANIAQTLMDNIEKYTRFRVGVDGTEFADIGFFKKDAASLIWQLLIAYYRLSESNSFDAYHFLKKLREPALPFEEVFGDGV